MRLKDVAGVAAVVLAFGGVIALGGLMSTRAKIAEHKAAAAAHDRMTIAMSATCVSLSGDPDRDFARLMISHHQGAVDMAEIELQYGTDPEIRSLAWDIVTTQRPQIDQMSRWKREHPASAPAKGEAERSGYAAANSRMMRGMASGGVARSQSADLDFVRMMLPHHQGAVDMAEVELELGRDPGLRTLARNIVVGQRAEIAQMTAWLRRNGR